MTSGLRALQPADMARAVAKPLVPSIAMALKEREPGHCMRVFDLDTSMSVTIAQSLRRIVGSASVFVLGEGTSANSSDSIFVTSTKLVELRNPLPDGLLRPPLCVFVPPGIKTSAEDSFGAATFEDFALGDETLVYFLVSSHRFLVLGEVFPAGNDHAFNWLMRLARSACPRLISQFALNQ